MSMVMFAMEQRIRIVEDEDKTMQDRKATVVKINYDGSALVRVDGSRGERVAGRTVWPEDCEPL